MRTKVKKNPVKKVKTRIKGIRLFAVTAILSLVPLVVSIGIISLVSATVVRDNLEKNTKNP